VALASFRIIVEHGPRQWEVGNGTIGTLHPWNRVHTIDIFILRMKLVVAQLIDYVKRDKGKLAITYGKSRNVDDEVTLVLKSFLMAM